MTSPREGGERPVGPVNAQHAEGVQAGDRNVQNNYFGRQRVVTWPCRVGAVPRLAFNRQQRPTDDMIAAAMAGGGTAVVCQVVAGMGGVGKTQVAANLAEQWWKVGAVDLLLWVTATSRENVVNTYAQAAADITGAEDPDRQQAASRLLAWLAGTDRKWLVVLDDVVDPQHLAGLWPPDTAFGRTVITTRRRDTAMLDGRRLVDVTVFTQEEADAYLHGQLGDSSDRLDEADLLAEDLGRLPLALAQAATYIRDQDLTCVDYRQRLRKRRLARLSPTVLPDGQQQAVAQTWALSIELADIETGGLAGVVLQLAAILDPNGIPAPVFATPIALSYYGHRAGHEIDDDDARDAVRALYRLGLADATTDPDGGELLRVHALVQRVVRESTPAEHQPELAYTAATALIELWPDTERDAASSRLGQLLRANTTTLAAVAGDHLWYTPDGTRSAHLVLFRIGSSLGEIGLVAAARDYYQRLLTDNLRILGSDHPDVLTTRTQLARWQGEAGDAAGAATAFEQVVADRVRMLGADHPYTLAARSQLADWRGETGDPAGAVAAYKQLLADRVRILGADHPHALNTRHNLADWRGMAGDPARAVTELEKLLTDRVRLLGPDHPDTLTTRSLLATWRGEAGDAPRAVAKLEQVLVDRLRALGPNHPDTLNTRHNVAYWRGMAGDPARAVTELEKVLTDRVRLLGPDHPDTLTTRSQLARWRGEAGDPAGALAELEQVLADRVRVLGPDHPDTLTVRHNRAYFLGEAGDLAGAAAAFEQVVTERVRMFGPDHPSALAARSQLARWRGEAGDPAGAAAAYEQLLVDRVRALGPNHPDVEITRHNLAHWRAEAATAEDL
ncbi:FxSxx-COOH system tetratricopeptide repeat protein [Paractinoplanes rhizophilus]|uniref:FxSxx-COOH system tetratricopeptide repeat protein n=1 Tax=Paractinoplanes rhizophilus TaxID=1416877 RepID=A0ABW2I533_9ACTN